MMNTDVLTVIYLYEKYLGPLLIDRTPEVLPLTLKCFIYSPLF
jgi:hypothetical protein